MAQTKKDLFSNEEVWLARAAKALSHPARIKILKILTDARVCMCGDIVDLLPLSQSTVSQHLKELKEAGLIQGEVDGPKVCYCIDEKNIIKAMNAFSVLFSKVCNCVK